MDGKDFKQTPKYGYHDQDDRQSAYSDVLADDSDTIVSDETLYTPSPSNGTSSSKDTPLDEEDSLESDRLLPPPSYEVQPPVYQSGDAKVDVPEEVIPNRDLIEDIEVEDSTCPCKSRRGCFGRGGKRWSGTEEGGRCRRGCFGRRKKRCGFQSTEPKKPRTKMQMFLYVAKVSILAWIFVQVFCLVFFRQTHSSGYWDQYRKNRPHHHHSSNPDDSRETIIKESSRSVTGEFPLDDYLSISTSSGQISVVVIPQPADPANPTKPARLSLKSQSGSISVSFALPDSDYDGMDLIPGSAETLRGDIGQEIKKEREYAKKCTAESRSKNPADCADYPLSLVKSTYTLPPRPYEIEIESRSGSIFAKVGFTSKAKLSTRSGSIQARLVPLIFTNSSSEDEDFYDGFNSKRVSIHSESRSGSTLLSVADPLVIEVPEPTEDEDFVFIDSASDWAVNGEEDDDDDDEEDDKVTIMKRGRHVRAKATHLARSGALSVSYPKSWAGKVLASTRGSGKASIVGDGFDSIKRRGRAVEGIKRPKDGAKKHWWGSQGDMKVELSGREGAVGFELRR